MALVNYLKILFESSWISKYSFLWICSNKVSPCPHCHYWTDYQCSERLIIKTITRLTCGLSVLMIFIIKGLNMIVIWNKYILVSSKDWIWGNRCSGSCYFVQNTRLFRHDIALRLWKMQMLLCLMKKQLGKLIIFSMALTLYLFVTSSKIWQKLKRQVKTFKKRNVS